MLPSKSVFASGGVSRKCILSSCCFVVLVLDRFDKHVKPALFTFLEPTTISVILCNIKIFFVKVLGTLAIKPGSFWSLSKHDNHCAILPSTYLLHVV